MLSANLSQQTFNKNLCVNVLPGESVENVSKGRSWMLRSLTAVALDRELNPHEHGLRFYLTREEGRHREKSSSTGVCVCVCVIVCVLGHICVLSTVWSNRLCLQKKK